MRITLFLILSIWTNTLLAQMPMAGGNMTPPEFNAEKAAGIYSYDVDEVLKKLKIDDKETQQKVTEALNAHNKKMYQLSFDHVATFQELENDFNRNLQIAMQNRDRSQMNGVKSKIQQDIPPIRMETVAEENILNQVMANTLTEKQNSKWLKYQQRKKE